MKIIQIVSDYMRGDAVSKVADTIEKSISSIGIQMELLTGSLTEEQIESDAFSDCDMIMYHLSVRIDPLLYYIKCKKILVFHNITTPELLVGFDVEGARLDCEAGLYELDKTSKYFDYALVFSDYSRDFLVEHGWNVDKIVTLPIILKFDELSGPADLDVINKYSDGKRNFAFFGRLFPNKKQEDIIKSFEMYRRKYDENSRLILVGSGKAPKYENLLKKYVRDLGLEEYVVFTGFVSQQEYIAYYKISDCFICMSEHEGFCIPLIEAMYFDVPVIAYNSTAVPSTLGGAGILLDSKQPEMVSDYMNKVITEKQYRNKIIEGQRIRVEYLKSKDLISQYSCAIKKMIDDSRSCTNTIETNKHIYFGDKIFTLKLPDCIMNTQSPVVIYGIGKWGKKLYNHMLRCIIPNNIAICDRKNAGANYIDCVIMSIEKAVEKYPDGFWIVTPERKEVAIEMIVLLIKNNVSTNRIATYNGYLNVVKMLEE